VDYKLQAYANVVHPDADPEWLVMAAVKKARTKQIEDDESLPAT
jgi:hypothetical protein